MLTSYSLINFMHMLLQMHQYSNSALIIPPCNIMVSISSVSLLQFLNLFKSIHHTILSSMLEQVTYKAQICIILHN